MATLKLIIDGDPMGKQRPKLTSFGGHPHAYTPKETINYESKVVNAYKEQIKGTEYENTFMFPNETPVFATIIANFGLSKADYGKKGLNKSGRTKLEQKYCTKHLDTDNIAKICLDALNGICYADDKQIVALFVEKMWVETKPSVEIILENAYLPSSEKIKEEDLKNA